MSTKLMNFLCMIWLISVIICNVVEGTSIGSHGEQTVLNDLSLVTSIKVGGMIPIPMFNINFFRGVFRLLTWDYGFYTGGWQLLRWFWTILLSPGAIWGMGSMMASVFANFVPIPL